MGRNKQVEGSTEGDVTYVMRHCGPARGNVNPTHNPCFLLGQLTQPPADNKPPPRVTQTKELYQKKQQKPEA